MAENLKLWWSKDAYRQWLLIVGFVYAFFFSQGLPLWDGDFTYWFSKFESKSLFTYIWEWFWPISTEPQTWGFNERPLQAIIYKICYLISGYDSWSYYLYKSVVYAGLGVLIYQWGLRLVPKTPMGQKAALAAAVFFLVAPGPMGAHILHQDFAPTAELIFLGLTYLFWEEIESTPKEWTGFPRWDHKEQKQWINRWVGFALLAYLGYKSKADVKLIPLILAVYIAVVRRHQLKLFALPLGLMFFLAVPWGSGVFSHLPPFVPGSKTGIGQSIFQPISIEQALQFIWAPGRMEWLDSFRAPSISLAGWLGPFLLIGILIFLGWRMEAFDKVSWGTQATPTDRSRIFALIWFVVILVGASSLPPRDPALKVGYGILTLVPASLLLAWVFGVFVDAANSLPKWFLAVGVALFVIQAGINLNRSIVHRRGLGQQMVAVDQAYDYIQRKIGNEKIAVIGDFKSYDYRPDAGVALRAREWISNANELLNRFPAMKSYALSWQPSLWDQLEMVEKFSGCRESSVFDRIFPCRPGTGAFLMRFIGSDPGYVQGEVLRSKGDMAGARKHHEEFVSRFPLSLAGHFIVGLEAFQMRDWAKAEQSYDLLEQFLPGNLQIVYNHALSLIELGKYNPGIERLRYVLKNEPKNYAVLINLYYAHVKNAQPNKAKDILSVMKREFPNDKEVSRLISGSL